MRTVLTALALLVLLTASGALLISPPSITEHEAMNLWRP